MAKMKASTRSTIEAVIFLAVLVVVFWALGSRMGSGNMLNYKVYNKNYWNDIPGLLEIDVPDSVLDPSITVLAVLLDSPIRLYRGEGEVITAN